MSPDEQFMGRALELARSVWGTTHPNPMVGAVVLARRLSPATPRSEDQQ